MNLTLPAILLLSQQCAPSVAPETLLSVAHVESRFDPLTIGINGKAPRALHPMTKADAVRQATGLIARGVSVDLGLGQINSKNLGWLGLSIADAFDPCTNLAAAARVLARNYGAAAPDRDPQSALRVAFSLYNTGDEERGFRNGYVQKIAQAAAYVVPAIQVSAPPEAPDPPAKPEAVALTAAAEPAAWDVFARRETSALMVFQARAEQPAHRAAKPNSRSSGARK